MKNAVAIHGPLGTVRGLVPSLAIDGDTVTCTSTRSRFPWLQVDLKTAYLITSVEAFFWRGNNAIVRVGSNLKNDGNANPQCGQRITISVRTWSRRATCSLPLWGRYINVQIISSTTSYLEVCELRATYSKKMME